MTHAKIGCRALPGPLSPKPDPCGIAKLPIFHRGGIQRRMCRLSEASTSLTTSRRRAKSLGLLTVRGGGDRGCPELVHQEISCHFRCREPYARGEGPRAA
jgi:hypothetical protein